MLRWIVTPDMLSNEGNDLLVRRGAPRCDERKLANDIVSKRGGEKSIDDVLHVNEITGSLLGQRQDLGCQCGADGSRDEVGKELLVDRWRR